MQRSWRERNPTYHSEHAVGYKTRKLALARKRKYGDEKRPCPEHCEICGKRFNAEVSADRACFDHDHGTIAHRGWPCNSCNVTLARLGDTLEGAERFVRYLERAK